MFIPDLLNKFLIGNKNNVPRIGTVIDKKLESLKDDDFNNINLSRNEVMSLVDKIVLWYEDKYPNNLVFSMINEANIKADNLKDAIFKSNSYFTKKLDDDTNNYSNFVSFLPCNERLLLEDYKYPSIVNLENSSFFNLHLYLEEDGTIEESEYLEHFTKGLVTDDFAKGKKFFELMDFLYKQDIVLDNSFEFEEVGRCLESHDKVRRLVFEIALLKIIENGSAMAGPRRGMIFASEFGLDFSLPIVYGLDSVDPDLESLTDIYLRYGGDPSLVCCTNYYDDEELKTDKLSNVLELDTKDYQYRKKA